MALKKTSWTRWYVRFKLASSLEIFDRRFFSVQPTQMVSTIAPPPGSIQIVQQIIGPNGEIQQIPIQLTSQQLQLIRAQMTGTLVDPNDWLIVASSTFCLRPSAKDQGITRVVVLVLFPFVSFPELQQHFYRTH